ncbi:1354_t:CDS:2, partial [Funneliformis mosseae]
MACAKLCGSIGGRKDIIRNFDYYCNWGGEQASKALYILDKFDAHINTNDVKAFGKISIKVKTRSNQLILTEKKVIESNIVEQHFIACDNLLSEHKEYISTDVDYNQKDFKNDYGKQDGNVEEMKNSDYENFTERYQNMDNDRKWKLTTELNEIKEYKYKKLPDMTTDLLRYLNSFRKYNTRDLRKAVFETQSWYMPFNRDTHFDLTG